MNGADGVALRTYTEREIESMETQDLLNLYKETGDESLKWPLDRKSTRLNSSH